MGNTRVTAITYIQRYHIDIMISTSFPTIIFLYLSVKGNSYTTE